MEMTREEITRYMHLSLDVMMASRQEKRNDEKVSPFVGAVLVKPDGEVMWCF